MNRSLVFFLILVLAGGACKTAQQKGPVGRWVVAEVRADFDERKVNPATFNELVAYLRSTVLEIRADSTLTYTRGDHRLESGWHVQLPDGRIVIEHPDIGLMPLTPQNGRLFTTEMTPIGRIGLIFERDKS